MTTIEIGFPDAERSAWAPPKSVRFLAKSVLLALFLAVSTLDVGHAGADDLSEASIARGGRLYDNWFREIKDRAPAVPHPSHTSTPPSDRPAETWRCKTCHGWDYRGGAGPFESASIRGVAGAPVATIRALLTDKTHQYGGVLTERDLADLAAFVSAGQLDMAVVIDSATGRPRGSAEQGARYYASICANCHGPNGQLLHSMPALGAVARDDPWEALHKIMNGHAGENMPALRSFGREIAANILAYVQGLPPLNLEASIVRGGRLYDNWMLETKNQVPQIRHPAYPPEATYAGDPKVNWRCKECHGWDYRGNLGAFAVGRHKTGIGGIAASAGGEPPAIVAVLRDPNHRYQDVLAIRDLLDLSNFVAFGQIDMDRYIDPKNGTAKGNPRRQIPLFETLCGVCHGEAGDRIPTMPPLGHVARSNPWMALHKIMHGHPDEKMPALRILEAGALTDLLSHMQSLPE